MSQTIILKHSTVKDKLPSSAQYGEVFVNYHSENPFLATLNNQGQFEKFLSENKLNELYYNKSQVNDIIANLESGGTIDFDDYYKKIEVDTLLQGKSDTSHTHDYSQILNTPDLSNFATLSDIPSINGLASEVWVGENYQPKGNYLTEHQSLENYYTKSEADGKFLTSHQDLSDYAQKSDLDDYLTIASASTTYATKSEIPDISDLATKSEIPDTSNFITSAFTESQYQAKGTYVVPSDLDDYALKSELPTVPDVSDFITSAFTEEHYAQVNHTHSQYAEKSEIPDTSNFITSAFTEEHYMKIGSTPTDVYTKAESDSKFQPQSGMTDYALKSEIPSTTGLASETWVSQNFSTTAHTHDYDTLTNKPDLSIYLTEHQDISNLATKAELENYQPQSGMTDYALKSEIPDVSNFVTSAFTDATYAKKGEVPSDAYTKSETDTLLAGKANSAHTHTMSEITDLDIPKTWRGTLAEYNNLTEIDNDTLYIITDSSEQLVTSGDVESMISGYTNLTEVQTLLEGYSQTGHTHSYNDLTDKPIIPSTTGLASEEWVSQNFSTTAHTHSEYAEKTDLANYMPNSGMTDYALKSEIPNSYTKTEADNLLAGKANSAHTHTVSDITDLNIPSVEGLASEVWVSQNYQPQSGMSAYSTTAHTHSDLATKAELDDYLTIASASTTYATKEELEEFTPSDNYAGTVWTGTLSEYNNLTVIDTDTLYVITDANQQYVTSGQVESMTSGYTNLTEVQTLLEGYSQTGHTHSYNDLTDKPTIPSTTGLASEEWVTNNFAGTGHTHSQYAEKTDLANYQPQSGMTDYLTVASASTIYATKQELAEFTPSAGYVQNIWVGSLSDYENLTIVDRNTLYCITDEQEQLVTRSYAMNTFATKAMMSDYLTVSAASEMFVEKEAEPLPAYQFVDYIDVSGNTPGIITDYYLTANSVIEFDSEPALANYEMTLYGVTDADWGGMTEGVYAKYGSNQYTYHGYMAESAVQDVPSGRHTFKAGYNYGGEAMAGCQVDDGEIQTCSENYQSWGGQNNLPLGLFGVWSIDYDWNTSQVTGSTWNNNLGMKFNGKFYGCKVYEGNTLMRDYVPCVETSTGKVGIFDTLNDSFYETTASASTTVTGSSSAVTATTEETTSGETSGETSGSTSGSTSGETSGETTGQTAYTIDTSVYEVGDYIDLNRDTYDLNYLITRDSKFVLDIYLQAGQNYEEMFGIEDGGCFKIGTGESEGSVGLIFGDSQTRNTQYYIENDGRYVFEMSSGGTVVNGSIVDDWSQAGTVYGMTNSHCHLGGLWQVMVEDWGDGPMDMSSLRGEPYYRMYNFKVYEGNTLLRDYRPVKRLSDDAIGWFDVVNQTFMGRDENNSSGEGASLGYNE